MMFHVKITALRKKKITLIKNHNIDSQFLINWAILILPLKYKYGSTRGSRLKGRTV